MKSNADVVDDDGVVQSGRCFIFAYYILWYAPGEMELECFSSFTFVFPVESSGIFVRADR